MLAAGRLSLNLWAFCLPGLTVSPGLDVLWENRVKQCSGLQTVTFHFCVYDPHEAKQTKKKSKDSHFQHKGEALKNGQLPVKELTPSVRNSSLESLSQRKKERMEQQKGFGMVICYLIEFEERRSYQVNIWRLHISPK